MDLASAEAEIRHVFGDTPITEASIGAAPPDILVKLSGLYTQQYIHDVNVDASQADRALNWTARINKVVERVTQEQIHIF